jgi:ACS family tartrate transporter-like MFS transporter
VRLAALALAASGTLSFAPLFWTIAPSFLSGAAAAGGLAAIRAMGILGGFLTPWFVGYPRCAKRAEQVQKQLRKVYGLTKD